MAKIGVALERGNVEHRLQQPIDLVPAVAVHLAAKIICSLLPLFD
jgi:hypothetical protein